VAVSLIGCYDGSGDDSSGSPAKDDDHDIPSGGGASARSPRGKDWTEAEVLDVISKIVMVAKGAWYPELVYEAGAPYECRQVETNNSCVRWSDNDEGQQSQARYHAYMPITPKLLRLGFHDCLKYTDGSGGCDGCLNFKNMFHRFEGGTMSLPDSDFMAGGDNNDLAIYGDILEKLYTDPAYPPNSAILDVSLKESGKSRADLWA
jgi:hypothetical protein